MNADAPVMEILAAARYENGERISLPLIAEAMERMSIISSSTKAPSPKTALSKMAMRWSIPILESG